MILFGIFVWALQEHPAVALLLALRWFFSGSRKS